MASSQNVPLLTQKHESNYTVCAGTENIGVHGAYAFTDHLEAMAGFSYGQTLTGPYLPIVTKDIGYRMSEELAMGYYAVPLKRTSFEIFGGLETYNRIYNYMDEISAMHYNNVACSKPFVQANFGYKNSRGLALAFSIKMGYLLYKDHIYYTDFLSSTPEDVNDIRQKLWLIEPAITFRTEAKRISLFFQFGYAIPGDITVYDYLNENPYFTDNNIFFKRSFVNLGLTLSLKPKTK
jgi:hypothetical protein